MGLDDRDGLRMLRDAVDPRLGSEELIRRFYTRWFAIDMAVRDLFPPELGTQFKVFGQALTWLFGELIDQRADEPVAFLAQLGRDHRKYGVTQRHYDSMQDALYTTLRSHLIQNWDDKLADTAQAAVGLIVGVMRGAADAEQGPPFCDGTVVELNRVSRDISVIRLQLDQPLFYYPGQYVTVQVPQWPRRWRYLSPAIPAERSGGIEFHVRSVTGGMVSPTIVGEARPGDRWRLSNPHGGMQVDREAGDVLMVAGSTGLAPLRALIMDLTQWGVNPRVHLFFGARYPCELYDLRTLWQDRVEQPLALGVPGVGVPPRPAVGCRLPRCAATPRTARASDRQAAGGGDQVRQLGRPTNPDLRRPQDGGRYQGSADRQRRTGRTHPARSAIQLKEPHPRQHRHTLIKINPRV